MPLLYRFDRRYWNKGQKESVNTQKVPTCIEYQIAQKSYVVPSKWTTISVEIYRIMLSALNKGCIETIYSGRHICKVNESIVFLFLKCRCSANLILVYITKIRFRNSLWQETFHFLKSKSSADIFLGIYILITATQHAVRT